AGATKKVGDFVTATKAALDGALQKAFDLIKKNAPEQLPPASQKAEPDKPAEQRPQQGPSPASGLKYAAAGVPQQDRHQFGDMIVARFAAAGFGRNQQVAAVANAIGESRLNPK